MPQIFQFFFDAFVKLRNVTINPIISVCLSSQNKYAPTEWIFMKFHI